MENLEIRQVVSHVVSDLMKKDNRILILDADLAKAVGTTGLHKEFPDHCFNLGIAEANMVSVAAGLSTYGYIPLTFTFAPFSSRRVCDQVALSICFSKGNVKLFGCDPGITAQINGATHMGNDDIGALRSIPDLMIFEPSDAVMMKKLLPEVIYYDGPVYIRMLRKKAVPVYDEKHEFNLFKIEVTRSGNDITLVSSGIMVSIAMEAAMMLEKEGISAEVLDVHTIKPLDTTTLVDSLKKTGSAVVCENHNVIGGLGSATAEAASKFVPVPMEFIGVQDHFGQPADLKYLLEKFHMKASDIVEAAHSALKRKVRS
jgi:transketolase